MSESITFTFWGPDTCWWLYRGNYLKTGYRGVDWIDQNCDWLTSNWLFTETFMDPFKDLQREIHVQRWRISIYCTYWSPQPAPKLTTWTKEFCLIFTLFQLCKLDHPAISYRKENTLLFSQNALFVNQRNQKTLFLGIHGDGYKEKMVLIGSRWENIQRNVEPYEKYK